MSTSDLPTDARARLLNHFATAKTTPEHSQKWDDLYQANWLPWDKGLPNPALIDLLTTPPNSLPSSPIDSESGRRRKALVPGCGKGYDVLLLAAFGYEAYGLEVSKTALQACEKVEKECAWKGEYEVRVEGGSVNWLYGDFFADEFLRGVKSADDEEEKEEKKFDLIYDYTFLSALPPTTRPAWSQRNIDLLSPLGRLICIEFPTYKPASTGGPPWALPPKVYLAHLTRPGRELAYSDVDGELEEDEEKLGETSENGLVRLEHFQPKRSHAISYDQEGKTTDWVGIWGHPERWGGK